MVLGGGPVTVGSGVPGVLGTVELPLPPTIAFGTPVMITGQCMNGATVHLSGPMSEIGAGISC
jgi:hypothetical protein